METFIPDGTFETLLMIQDYMIPRGKYFQLQFISVRQSSIMLVASYSILRRQYLNDIDGDDHQAKNNKGTTAIPFKTREVRTTICVINSMNVHNAHANDKSFLLATFVKWQSERG